MKALLSMSNVTDETVSFLHQSLDNAVRNGARISITLIPEDNDIKPAFPRSKLDRRPGQV